MQTNASRLDRSLVTTKNKTGCTSRQVPLSSFDFLPWVPQQNSTDCPEPTRYVIPQPILNLKKISSKHHLKFDAVPELAPQQTDRTDLGELLSLKERPNSDCRPCVLLLCWKLHPKTYNNSHKGPLLVWVKYCTYLNLQIHECTTAAAPLFGPAAAALQASLVKLWKSCYCSFGRNINLIGSCRVSWPLYSCDCLPSFRNRSL